MRFPLEQVSGSMMNEAADWANYSDFKLERKRPWGSDILFGCAAGVCGSFWSRRPSGCGPRGSAREHSVRRYRAHVLKLVHAWFLCVSVACGFEWKRGMECAHFESN